MSISKATLRAALLAATLLPTGVRAGDVAADVAARLRESGSLQGFRVNVKEKSGTVWLEGRVADQRQLAAAVGIAETSPGVERVVNRLTVESASPAAAPGLSLPASMQALAGTPARPAPKPVAPRAGPGQPAGRDAVALAQAVVPAQQPKSPSLTAAFGGLKPLFASTPGKPRPQPPRPTGGLQPAAYQRVAMQGVPLGSGPMTLPSPQGDCDVPDGQIVPGSVRYSDGGPGGPGGDGVGMPGGYAGGGPGMGGPGMGGPMPMAGTGVGMPPIPMRGDGPNMPNYAWPSYAAYPNYAALQYPTQYSPTAWPYIGPFYPYPQVPLGWRRVSLEWDDGWWWLDFDERHLHNHHK
ncbi:MAG: BON domain-containing protein [Planctomycetaceae bacterium]